MLKVNTIRFNVARAVSHYKNVIKRKKPAIVRENAGEPLITCRRPEFNVYHGDKLNEAAKLGEIPLTTDGWHHYKSKGDFFILHPHPSAEDVTRDLKYKKPFDEFAFSAELKTNLASRLNMEFTTFIQHETFPHILNNQHTLIAAETGCGKTMAYLAPIVQNVLNQKQRTDADGPLEFNTPKALIITPGRELAEQIGEVCENLCHGLNLKTKIVIGGHTKSIMMNPPIEDIDILVASIGALSKLITANIYRMHEIRHVVLDEADTLLDDSFVHKLQYVLKRFPVCSKHCFHFPTSFPKSNPQFGWSLLQFYKNVRSNHDPSDVSTQLVLASATMPTNVEESLSLIIDTSTLNTITSPYLHRVMPHITQKFIRMRKSHRPIELLSLIKKDMDRKRPVIVFSNKRETSDYVSIFLNDHGIETVSMNKSAIEKIRRQQFRKFQTGQVGVLSTTDLASRGLDTKRVNIQFASNDSGRLFFTVHLTLFYFRHAM